jgi:glyoxylase-like metal-dependent hydrolase (beta-lactamase superfamily II)
LEDVDNCIDINGLKIIIARSHLWPNPSNVCAILDDKGFSMIDVGCGGPAGYEYLRSGLRHFGLTVDRLHTVVLSHAHPDHMGAMKYLLETVHPEIFIHINDLNAALDINQLNESFDIPLAKRMFAPRGMFQDFDLIKFFEIFGCSMNQVEDIKIVTDEQLIKLGNFEFEVLHTPGHAPGHIALFERSVGVLFANDLIGVSPAWYTPSSGGLIGYLESLDRLKSKNASVLVPSHGPIMSDPEASIRRIREKLIKRETILLETLSTGPQKFNDLLSVLFPETSIHFFPGCGILESHLIKLEKEDSIERREDLVFLIGNG